VAPYFLIHLTMKSDRQFEFMSRYTKRILRWLMQRIREIVIRPFSPSYSKMFIWRIYWFKSQHLFEVNYFNTNVNAYICKSIINLYWIFFAKHINKFLMCVRMCVCQKFF